MTRVRLFAGVATLALSLAAATLPLSAQGIIPGRSQAEDLNGTSLASIANITPQELATVQRLLTRLGYLPQGNPNRTLDAATVGAIANHLAAVGWQGTGPNPEQLLRSLFGAVWIKEGWSTGSAPGQQIMVGRDDVRRAQDALKQLGGAPGPVDGIFGPATLAAVEGFQAENGIKVTGLLTPTMLHNILRAAAFGTKTPAATLRILSAEGVVDPAALQGFEQATNMRVIQDTYVNQSETKELLMQGSATYDLMVQAGAEMRQVLEKPDAVTKIDRLKIPNTLRLDTASQIYTESLDPLNEHSIPYLWGTIGLGVNKERVTGLVPDAPLNSMALVLDPKYASTLASCGIAMVDEPIDVIPSIVSYVGGDFRNVGITDLEAVDQALTQIKDYVQVVPKAQYVDGLANGKYCASIGFSGDVLTAREEAKARQTGTIVYAVPKEGSELWFQLFVIPKNAKNQDAAHALIDYFLKPEVAAAGTKALNYANTVWAAGPLLEAKLLDDPALYPPRETMSKLSIQPPLSADVEAELNRIWSKLKKG
ncbi:extracellular solute-binding protein [Aestuariivirga sp.]|uniref:extracellular solute-binding protein n=1 Tax=Aestuariivirga sp. TaxID=2650926 RepID=UPI0039E6E8AF